ncbi:unnamed protein product [Prorocentrum cordatum]|uniref:Uncharacterized protein n=1 Tax=Prorocentrum cordatum TaxID=2364126 RepID=A0ABN9X5X1_9DINO|nr:unnamed protein product [Polarella glacialis]
MLYHSFMQLEAVVSGWAAIKAEEARREHRGGVSDVRVWPPPPAPKTSSPQRVSASSFPGALRSPGAAGRATPLQKAGGCSGPQGRSRPAARRGRAARRREAISLNPVHGYACPATGQ